MISPLKWLSQMALKRKRLQYANLAEIWGEKQELEDPEGTINPSEETVRDGKTCERKKVSKETMEEGHRNGKERTWDTTRRHQAASCNTVKSRMFKETTQEEKKKTSTAFYRDPYKFVFVKEKTRALKVPVRELEQHLRKTNSGNQRHMAAVILDNMPP